MFGAGAAHELFGLATFAPGLNMVPRHHIELALSADRVAPRCEVVKRPPASVILAQTSSKRAGQNRFYNLIINT